MRTFTIVLLLSAITLLPAGCPPTPNSGSSPVTASITISATSGPAPLQIAVSGATSQSSAGAITSFAWDFAGLGTASGADARFNFLNPGRYRVSLTATDEAGNTAVDSVDVRVAGGPVMAVISAAPTSGRPPLLVRFDGSGSTAERDKVDDYFWDFGDGTESRLPKPTHVYQRNGTFTVMLKAVSAGGVEGTATTDIMVGGPTPALQFDAGQLATLSLATAQNLTAFTAETWFKAENEGGSLIILGNAAASLSVLPGSGTIHATVASVVRETPASNLAGQWRHVALVYETGAGATLYLDGVALENFDANTTAQLSALTIGSNYRGKLAEVRLWSVARSAAEISASRNARVSGTENGLLGAWPLNEGAGQRLTNAATGQQQSGVLGLTASVESNDPAWSQDGPPLP